MPTSSPILRRSSGNSIISCRTIPGTGRIVVNGQDEALKRVLAQGLLDPGRDISASPTAGRRAVWTRTAASRSRGRTRPWAGCDWALSGEHNRMNALAAIAAARHAGVAPAAAIDALSRFQGVRRRLELRGTARGVRVYDDFAHHPTAIRETIAGLRQRVSRAQARILAVFEPRSNTLKRGVLKDALPGSFGAADKVYVYDAGLSWSAAAAFAPLGARVRCESDLAALVTAIAAEARDGDQVLVMSNGSFGGIHQKLLQALGAMIVYLHGFNSSPASHKAQVLKQFLEGRGLGHLYACPALPDTPAEAIRAIETRYRGSARARPHPRRQLAGRLLRDLPGRKAGLPRRVDQPGGHAARRPRGVSRHPEKPAYGGAVRADARAPGRLAPPAGRTRRSRSATCCCWRPATSCSTGASRRASTKARAWWCATAATTRCRASPSTSSASWRLPAFERERARMNVLYEEEGEFKVGAVLAQSPASFQVESPHGRRAKIKAASVVLSFERPSAAELLARGAQVRRRPGHGFPLAMPQGRANSASRTSRATTSGASRRRRRAPACCSSCTRRRCISTAAAAGASRRRRRKRSSSRSRAWRRRSACRSRSRSGPAQLSRFECPPEIAPPARRAAVCAGPRQARDPRRSSRPAARPGCPRPRLFERCGLLPDSHEYHLGRFVHEFYPKGDRLSAARRGRRLRPDLPLAEVAAFSLDDIGTTEIDDAFSVTRVSDDECASASTSPRRASRSRPARRWTRSRASGCRPPTCRAARSPCFPRT